MCLFACVIGEYPPGSFEECVDTSEVLMHIIKCVIFFGVLVANSGLHITIYSLFGQQKTYASV